MNGSLTVAQAAAELGVHRQTIYRLIWSRLLRHVKVGIRAIRIPAGAIAEYRTQFEVAPLYAGT